MSATEKLRPDPEVGQIYEQSRDENRYQILYVDDQIVLLRDEEGGRDRENVHRMERRTDFEGRLDSGWFELKPDSDLDMMDFSEIDWSEVRHIGEMTAENMHDEGYVTRLDIQQADDDELLDVDGLGEAGLGNLRQFSQ